MIRYALHCLDCEAEFEAWFASSGAYDAQAEAGQVKCPACDGARTAKQIMAPAVSTAHSKDFASKMSDFAARARRHISENFDYVGDRFADEARAIHYGETDERPIWGKTRPDDAKALAEEGVAAVPLPKAFAPPDPKPERSLN